MGTYASFAHGLTAEEQREMMDRIPPPPMAKPGYMNGAVLGSNAVAPREPPVPMVLSELDQLMKELYDEVDKLGNVLSPVMRPAVPEPMPGPGDDQPQSPLHESLLGVRDRVRFNLIALRMMRSRLTI
jgi:hypothetical protein